MTRIHHINCGRLFVPGYPTVVCHCLLLDDAGSLALVDAGIGLLEVKDPDGRLGRQLIELAGFQFNEPDTAVRRIEKLGHSPEAVRHIILTHADPDHAGGLADFPNADVHVSQEELDQLQSDHWRYVPAQFEHGPRWTPHGESDRDWFGLKARPLGLNFSSEVLLVPLFGHTLGHCGVAIQQGGRWLLHVGDAYYLKAELDVDDHPVSAMAAQRADDDASRRASLAHLRRLHRDHADEIEMVGYHDVSEFSDPAGALDLGV